MKDQVKVFCDFDGTLSTIDVTHFLLSRLADPSWNEIEGRWIRGEIGSRECLERQIPLLRGGWKAIASILDEVPLDPTFPAFASWCNSQAIPLVIVSDGLDRVIQSLLKREKVSAVEIRANDLIEKTTGELAIRFPYPPQDQNCSAGLCKCQFFSQAEGLNIVIGDGQSDFCCAGKADKVFAKSKLLAHCRRFRIPHETLDDFGKAKKFLRQRS